MVTVTRRAIAFTLLVAAAGAAGCSVALPPFPPEPKPGTVFHSFRRPGGPGPFNIPTYFPASLNNLYGDIDTPTLILMGADDGDTPGVVASCVAGVERIRRAGRPVEITLYPGAGHVFDAGPARHAPSAARATEDMFRFFSRHLRGESAA